MASYLLATVVLVVFACGVTGVQGALGDACTDDANCTTTSAICDSAQSKCLLQVDGDCSSGNDADCVTNAECDTASTNKCICKAGYEKATTRNVCSVTGVQGALGDACTDDANCTTTSAICDSAQSKCLLQVDADCSSGNDADCVTNAECDTASSNKCICKAGYEKATTRNVCSVTGAVNLGDGCSNSTVDCTTTTPASVCDTTEKCLLPAGGDCSSPNSEKCVSNAACNTTSNKCDCNDGITPTSEGLCNSASSVIFSATIVMLAAILGLLTSQISPAFTTG